MRVRHARFGYDPGGDSPHVAFCDALNAAMAELNMLLEKAYALGLMSDARIVQAAYVYDQNNDFWTRKWLTVPLTSQCETMSNEVWQTVANVRAVLGAEAPPPLRPDYTPDDPFKLPTWMPMLLGLGLVAYLFGPAIRGFQSRRLSGYSRRR